MAYDEEIEKSEEGVCEFCLGDDLPVSECRYCGGYFCFLCISDHDCPNS